jgi:hypothetical protein
LIFLLYLFLRFFSTIFKIINTELRRSALVQIAMSNADLQRLMSAAYTGFGPPLQGHSARPLDAAAMGCTF